MFAFPTSYDRERDEEPPGHVRDGVRQRPPAFERGRHVENHHLVDALGGVTHVSGHGRGSEFVIEVLSAYEGTFTIGCPRR